MCDVEEIEEALRGLKLPRGSYVAVFGSVARGKVTPLSDVDLLFKNLNIEDVLNIMDVVERVCKREVEAVDVKKLKQPTKFSALSEAKLLAGDYEEFVKDRWLATLEWLDIKDVYLSTLKNRLKRLLG